MSGMAVEVQDLHKSFGPREAVAGISFSIAPGEIFGLLGPNGAGKSTTISMLSGLTQPSSGLIRLGGLDLATHQKQIKARLGLVPQELALYPSLSARDNLLFFGQIYGLRGKNLQRRIAEVLEIVQLAERAREPIERFSGGMKRRINLAIGLLHQPDLLFLDEPTVGVDPQSRNAIFESIEALNRAGMTIIYTTHYMEEAERLCHRVAILDHGQIIALDTPANLIRSLAAGRIAVEIDNGQVETVLEQVRQLPCIQNVTRREQLLDIQSEASQETLTQVLEITGRVGARVTSLQILDANLETVFLSLTGKSLRE